jgi:hypothetical protein
LLGITYPCKLQTWGSSCRRRAVLKSYKSEPDLRGQAIY